MLTALFWKLTIARTSSWHLSNSWNSSTTFKKRIASTMASIKWWSVLVAIPNLASMPEGILILSITMQIVSTAVAGEVWQATETLVGRQRCRLEASYWHRGQVAILLILRRRWRTAKICAAAECLGIYCENRAYSRKSMNSAGAFILGMKALEDNEIKHCW